jgi:hypothetical protein
LVAKILVINRCLELCSHYSVPRWIKTTALPQILGENVLELNDDKIYYDLSSSYFVGLNVNYPPMVAAKMEKPIANKSYWP